MKQHIDWMLRNIRATLFLVLFSLFGTFVNSAQAAIVTLAWDGPPAGSDVASYLVQYGTQPGQYATGVACGLSPQCAVSVPNNQTYYFVVRAVGSSGLQSPPSGEVVARVGTNTVLIGVSQSSVSFGAHGGSAVLSVTGTMAWAAASASPWLRVVPGSAATGPGMVSYAVTPNVNMTARNGSLALGGINIAVSQLAGPPKYWRLPMDLTAADYDGDGRTDVTVYRDTTGQWFTAKSTGGVQSTTWGAPTLDDIPVAADYDGDNRADVAVYRRTTGEWFIQRSLGGSTTTTWGTPTLADFPVPGDYDGDGRADIGVFRRVTGEWLVALSSGGSRVTTWGAFALDDLPVPADYDGDGITDIAVYRNSTGAWYVLRSAGGVTNLSWGAPGLGDMPVPGDYDGDGNADIAVYRGTTGQWLVANSSGGSQNVSWGSSTAGDIPVPGDYDGDGQTDFGVYRASTGQWLVSQSGGGTQTIGWGAPALTDIVRGR